MVGMDYRNKTFLLVRFSESLWLEKRSVSNLMLSIQSCTVITTVRGRTVTLVTKSVLKNVLHSVVLVCNFNTLPAVTLSCFRNFTYCIFVRPEHKDIHEYVMFCQIGPPISQLWSVLNTLNNNYIVKLCN